MKVILLKDVQGTGKKDQIVEVSDGFGRNFLLPRKMAIEATAEAIHSIESAKKAEKHRADVKRDEAERLSRELKGKVVIVKVRAGEGGRLYGSITGQEIADANRHSIFGKLPIDWSKAETQAGRDRFAYVQKLIKMRREHCAFTSPELEWLTPDNPDDCAAFLRKSADETVWCVFNLTQTPKRENFRLPDGCAFVEPLISSTGLLLKDGDLSVDLPAYGFAVVKLVPRKVDENK